jgi:Fe-S cluster assembly protein SufD
MTVSSSANNTGASLLSDFDFYKEFSDKRSWEPGWLLDFRKENWEKIREVESGLKDDRWRFSPKARLGYSKVLGLSEYRKGIRITGPNVDGFSLRKFDQMILEEPDGLLHLPDLKGPELGAEESFLLARSFAEDGFCLRVEKNVRIEKPVYIDHIASGGDLAKFHLNAIELKPFSELTMVERISSEEECKAGGFFTNLAHVTLGEGAKLNRIVIQNLHGQCSLHHLENFDIGANASLSNISIHLGSSQARIESKGRLLGQGSEFENSSVALGRDNQLFDQRTMQHHLAPNCMSRLTFKHALADQAKSVFSGLIKVENDAQNTNSYQTNRNLLLSDDSEADSMPGLEILANEVKCSHGATTSKIDDQELFYLLSRGISRSVAERLIVLGFFEEVIGKISVEEQLNEVRNSIADSFGD